MEFWNKSKLFGLVLGCVTFCFTFRIGMCTSTLCDGVTLENHEERADVIFTAYVINVTSVTNFSNDFSAKLRIKRVFKGNTILALNFINSMKLRSSQQPNIRTSDTYNAVVDVNGFGVFSAKCGTLVRQGDTRIIFTTFNAARRRLTLSAPVVPISVYFLDRVDHAVDGE